MKKDGEGRARSKTKKKFTSEGLAEPQPILSKDSERREQRPAKTKFSSAGFAEPPLFFYKDNANESKINRVQPQFILPDATPHACKEAPATTRHQYPLRPTTLSGSLRFFSRNGGTE